MKKKEIFGVEVMPVKILSKASLLYQKNANGPYVQSPSRTKRVIKEEKDRNLLNGSPNLVMKSLSPTMLIVLVGLICLNVVVRKSGIEVFIYREDYI